MRALRIAAGFVGVLLVAVLSTLMAVLMHLDLPETRSLARRELEALIPTVLHGGLDIGRLDHVSLFEIEATEVVWLDEQGRVVISADHLRARPDWPAILRGHIRIAVAEVERPTVVLHVVGEDGLGLSLVESFMPRDDGGPPSSSPLHLTIAGLRVTDGRVVGDIPRFPNFGLEDVDIAGVIDVEGRVRIQTYTGRATMVAPYPGRTELSDLTLVFDNEGTPLLDAYARADRGATHARVRALLYRGEGEGPMSLDLDAEAEPLDIATLADMGFGFARPLAGEARGHVTLDGPVDHLVFRSSLQHPAGPIDLVGHITSEEPWVFEADARDLALATLVPRAPETQVTGHARIVVGRDGADSAVEVRTEALEVLGYAVPAMTVRGRLGEAAFYLDGAEAPHLEGFVRASGRIGFEGSVDLEAEVDVADIGRDPNIARLVPGAHGAVRGRVSIVLPSFDSLDHVSFDLDLRQFQYGPVRVRSGRAHGTLRGPMDAFRVSVRASGTGLVISSIELGRFDASVEGGPRAYRFGVASNGGPLLHSVGLDGSLERHPDGSMRIALARYQVEVASRASSPLIALSGRDVIVDVVGDRVTFTRLDVGGFGDATIEGSISSHDARELEVHLPAFPMELLRPFLPDSLRFLTGTLALDLELDGPFTNPRFDARAVLRQCSLDGDHFFASIASASYRDGQLAIHADGDLGSRGAFYAHGVIEAPFSVLSAPARWVREARFRDFEVSLDQANVAFVTPLLGERVQALGLSGKATFALRIDGRLSDPSVPLGVLVLDRFGPQGWSSLRVKVAVRYEHERLHIDRIWIADLAGELLLAEAEGELPISEPAEGWIRHLTSHPWSVSARIEPRAANQWPRPIAKYLPRGMNFGGSATARGDGTDVSIVVESTARFVEFPGQHPCNEREQPIVQLRANLDDEAATGSLMVFADHRRIARLEATSTVPIRGWIRGDVPVESPLVALRAFFEDVPLGRLPWSCERMSGRLNGTAALDLFAPAPAIAADLDIRELRIRDVAAQTSRPYSVALRARSDGEDWASLGACLLISETDAARTPISQCALPEARAVQDNAVAAVISNGLRPQVAGPLALEGETVLRGAIPIRFDPTTGVPALGWKNALYVEGSFSEARIQPLLAWVPGIGAADAVADGRVVGQGGIESLQLRGGLELTNGRARIVSIGQYLDDISGRLHFEGQRIVFPEDRPLLAHDTGHRLAVTGAITMDGLTPRTLDAQVRANDFPVRREGTIVASIAGDARAHATIGKNGLDATVDAGNVVVSIPDRTFGSAIGLDSHPDVMVVGDAARELLFEGVSAYPYSIAIRTDRRFVVRRNDFEVEVEADLRAVYDDPNLGIEGSALLRGGYFEVFGKRLLVQRGFLRFEPGDGFDPAVSLLASYALPGRSGASISIEVSGRLSAPVVSFSSTETNDVGTILSMLVSASGTSTEESAVQAGGAASNLLSGLVLGLFMLSLRRELGDLGRIVPVVTVSNENGQVRANARWAAYDLVPVELRNVIIDATVEGAIRDGGGGGTTGATTGAGLAIELAFPYGLAGRVTYSPPQSWGADIAWQP